MRTKLEDAYNNYKKIEEVLICPICRKHMWANPTALVCENKHTFNINKKGIVSFAQALNDTNYNLNLFKSRNRILNSGIYQTVFESIIEMITPLEKKIVVDAGSGEGSYLNKIKEVFVKSHTIGIDLARDGLNMASNNRESLWMLADLSKIPLADHSVDIVLNVLSPANYKEFKRILKPKGYLIKVVVNSGYLHEIRSKLELKPHENNDVLDILQSHMNIISAKDIKYSYPVFPSESKALIHMTPLTHNKKIDFDLDHITIDLKILLCKTF